jgi:hypothetical protein
MCAQGDDVWLALTLQSEGARSTRRRAPSAQELTMKKSLVAVPTATATATLDDLAAVQGGKQEKMSEEERRRRTSNTVRQDLTGQNVGRAPDRGAPNVDHDRHD